MVRVTLLYDLDAFVDERRFFERQANCVEALRRGGSGAPRLTVQRVERSYASQSGLPAGFITTLEWPRDEAYRLAVREPPFAQLVRDVRALSDNAVVLVATPATLHPGTVPEG